MPCPPISEAAQTRSTELRPSELVIRPLYDEGLRTDEVAELLVLSPHTAGHTSDRSPPPWRQLPSRGTRPSQGCRRRSLPVICGSARVRRGSTVRVRQRLQKAGK